MKQKELAEMLGISGAMVSKLAARGMPTDTLERAKRWRKRHLEPGRVKGSKFDPTKVPSNPEGVAGSRASEEPQASTGQIDLAEEIAQEIAVHLTTSANAGACSDRLADLREILKALPADARPSMPVCVWVALVDWVLSDDAAVRDVRDIGATVTPLQFAALVCPDHPHDSWLSLACDWDGYSIAGLPECDD